MTHLEHYINICQNGHGLNLRRNHGSRRAAITPIQQLHTRDLARNGMARKDIAEKLSLTLAQVNRTLTPRGDEY
tara:strand:+ start:3947 stop:4168 length:222 start_codon:yes stop_codon:yes gene_type:complete